MGDPTGELRRVEEDPLSMIMPRYSIAGRASGASRGASAWPW